MSNEKQDKAQCQCPIFLGFGLGNQERGIKDTGLFDLDVVCTSDIDKDVMVSYAAIHNGLTNELIENYTDYPSREQMAQDLLDRNIGFDFIHIVHQLRLAARFVN